MMKFSTRQGIPTVIFLSDDQILSLIKKLCAKKQSPLQIAVAYWGDEALVKTKLRHRIQSNPETVQVICDLESGACNPGQIQHLLKANVRVKSLKNFHAKVWICDDVVIVGSANASSNGLGFFEGDSPRINVEAAVSVSDRTFAREVQQWFDSQWEAATRAEDKIKSARDRWNIRKSAISNARRLETNTNREIELPKERGLRYRAFFQQLLDDLNEQGYPLAPRLNPRPINYLQIGAGHYRISYFARFAEDETVRVELYISKPDQRWNQRKFDEIYERKNDIETKIGGKLVWDRADAKQKSSIVLDREGKIDDEDSKLREIRAWMVNNLLAFEDTFRELID